MSNREPQRVGSPIQNLYPIPFVASSLLTVFGRAKCRKIRFLWGARVERVFELKNILSENATDQNLLNTFGVQIIFETYQNSFHINQLDLLTIEKLH